MGKSQSGRKRSNIKERKTAWQIAVENMENGQTAEEALIDGPRAIQNRTTGRRGTVQWSSGQRKAIKRSNNG